MEAGELWQLKEEEEEEEEEANSTESTESRSDAGGKGAEPRSDWGGKRAEPRSDGGEKGAEPRSDTDGKGAEPWSDGGGKGAEPRSDSARKGVEPSDPVPLTQERVSELLAQAAQRIQEVVSHMQGCLEAGPRLEGCIGEVRVLELQRDTLVAQLLQLEQPMARAAQALRAELGEEHRRLARAELERRGLQEEVRRAKRRIFLAARDGIQSQVALATKQHEVAQFAITREELTTQIQELKEEASQLQRDQQEALREARERVRAAGRRRPRPRSDITHCRRLSLDLQQHLLSEVQALERRYEPRLLALLRRRQWGEEALRRQREEALDLRARVGPLREQARALELQRACAEERVCLLQREREENVAQYRGALEKLEQSLRELRTEVQVQKKTNKKMENLKNNLSKELDINRRFAEVYGIVWITPGTRSESGSCETLHR